MNTRTTSYFKDKWVTSLDLLIIIGISLALSILFYSHYYFGDELTAFFRSGPSKTFANIYHDLNMYKPRLIFNALWALYGDFYLPRYVPMIVNFLCMAGSASLLYLIAIQKLKASHAAALLLALGLVSSRFGAMLYFDYLSGNIETLSLLFCLLSVYCILDLKAGTTKQYPKLLFIIAFSCAMVLVHERYIAVAVVIGFFLATSTLHGNKRKTYLIFGTATALVPLVVFFIAGKVLSSTPISTGTAGRPVNIDIETLTVFATYVSNVVLGTNFGHPWFVGSLNIATFPGYFLIPTFIAVLTCLWIWLLTRLELTMVGTKTCLMLLCMFFALVAVASLPGPSKQESRWMFPAAAVLGLFIVSVSKRKLSVMLLSAYLIINAVYYLTGSYKTIFNVQAANSADQFGSAFTKLPQNHGVGIILSAPEPGTSWWLGGDTILGNDALSGLVFCRINFSINSACIFPPSAISKGLQTFSFGLEYNLSRSNGKPTYAYVDKAQLSFTEKVRAAAAMGDQSNGQASITATPSAIDLCALSTPKANITVRWSTRNPTVHFVTVFLQTHNGTQLLFAKGGPTGTAETGKWVASDISFVLTDSVTKTVLASATVKSKPCVSH